MQLQKTFKEKIINKHFKFSYISHMRLYYGTLFLQQKKGQNSEIKSHIVTFFYSMEEKN